METTNNWIEVFKEDIYGNNHRAFEREGSFILLRKDVTEEEITKALYVDNKTKKYS